MNSPGAMTVSLSLSPIESGQLVVIFDFDHEDYVSRISFSDFHHKTPLIIESQRMLMRTISLEFFEVIGLECVQVPLIDRRPYREESLAIRPNDLGRETATCNPLFKFSKPGCSELDLHPSSRRTIGMN